MLVRDRRGLEAMEKKRRWERSRQGQDMPGDGNVWEEGRSGNEKQQERQMSVGRPRPGRDETGQASRVGGSSQAGRPC